MKFCAKVVSEINFLTTLCMLNLKYVWRNYDKVNKGGSNYQNMNANNTNIISLYFVMVSVDSSKHVLILIKGTQCNGFLHMINYIPLNHIFIH
jgi:hypothetical protein